MNNEFKIHKLLNSLPPTLEPNSIYLVKIDSGFDFYVSDSTGSISYKANDLTATEILNLIKSVDGSGSGLDADTVDGIHGSALAPVNSPVFTGQLTLPNNARINGVEHFYQTTKPITRGDGSALVVSDRWWKTDDGSEWFWNGTYWLSQEMIRNERGYFINAGELSIMMPPTLEYSLFLSKCILSYKGASDYDSVNFWTLDILQWLYFTGAIPNLTPNTILNSKTSVNTVTLLTNTVIPRIINSEYLRQRISFIRSGTASPLTLKIDSYYNFIYH